MANLQPSEEFHLENYAIDPASAANNIIPMPLARSDRPIRCLSSQFPTSNAPISPILGHQKVRKLGKLACRIIWRIAKKSLKGKKEVFKVLLDEDGATSSMNGEKMIRKLAERYPKYRQFIHIIPVLFELFPSHTKQKCQSQENEALLNIIIQLMGKWLAVAP
jgi:hypothetical protein